MKRTFVKVLSFMLALAMIAGSFATFAFAEDAATCPGKNQRHTLANAVNPTIVKTYDPVCDKDGYTSYKCGECGVIFVDTYVKADVTTAHEWSEVTEAVAPSCGVAGVKAYQQCAKCEDYLIEGVRYSKTAGEAAKVIPALEHDYELVSSTGDCLAEGVKTYKCAHCGDEYTEDVVGTGEGHKWVLVSVDVKPSVDADGNLVPGVATYKCSACDTTTTFPVGCAHDEAVEIPAVAPTCTETGLTAGARCSVCGYITVEQEEVAALGHNEVIDAAVAPTCTATGLTEGKHCDVCGEVIVAQYVVDEALCVGATLVEFGAVAGDCVTKAVAAGEMCSVCEHVWKERVEGDYVHEVEPITVEPTCTKAGYEAQYCVLCEKVIDEGRIIPATGHTENLSWEEVEEKGLTINRVEATCEVDGVYNYYCANGCGNVMSVVIPATGHDTINVDFGPATCSTYYYTVELCKNAWCDYPAVSTVEENGISFSVVVNDYHYVPDSIEVDFTSYENGLNPDKHSNLQTLHVIQPADCKTPGHAITYCADCNLTDTDGVIDPLGHSWDRGEGGTAVETVDPTCLDAGWTTYKCNYCDETTKNLEEGDAVPATGHENTTVVPGYAASCLTDGLTDGEVCDDCGYVIHAQEVIEAVGHNLTYVETVLPKCDGTQGYDVYSCDGDNCDNDGFVYDNYVDYTYVSGQTYPTVDAANKVHNLDLATGEVLRPLTCEINGLITYTCNDCGKTILIEQLASSNHEWVEDDEVPADCENAGTEAGKTCTKCGATEGYAEIPALGHDFADEWTSDGENHWHVCLNGCDVVDAFAAHEYTDAITTEPTCVDLGVRTYTCDCGYYYTEDVDALGHDFADEWTTDGENHWHVCLNGCDVVDALAAHVYTSEITTEPTCTTTGVRTYTCDCGYSYAEVVSALGHDFQPTGVSSVLGCLTAQYDEYACERCGIVELRNYLPAQGHTEVIDEAVARDCDDTGLTEGRHCAICGDADEDYYIAQEEIPATGEHKNQNGDLLVDSCENTTEDRHCVECDQDIGQTHNADAIVAVTYTPTCVNVGYTTSVCLDCGLELAEPTDVQAPTGIHEYDEWDITTDPTCTETGVKQRDCNYCDAYETDVVEATGHTPKAELEHNENKHWTVCDVCGVEIVDTRVEHDWTLDWIEAEPQPGANGIYHYICVCGETKIENPEFAGIKVSFDYDNAIYGGAVVVNGGLVVLNVYLEGTEAKVENIQITFNYDADRLTYVSDSWNYFETAYATCNSGLGTILLDGKAGDTTAHSAVTINGKVCVGQIVFRVDDYEDVLAPNTNIDATTTLITADTVSALTPEDKDEDGYSDYINATFEADTLSIQVEKLGAISTNDKSVGVNDLSAIKEFVYNAEAEYNARADINQDGFVDGFDYIFLAQYLGGVYTYAEFVAIGVR